MKVQLDSTALEWLWNNAGDDFKLELQSAVVQQFANRYLKSLVTTEIMQQAKKQVDERIDLLRAEFSGMIAEQIGKVERGYDGKRLVNVNSDVARKIRNMASTEVDFAVRQMFVDFGKDETVPEKIEDWIKEQIFALVQKEYAKQIETQVKASIASLVGRM